MVKKTAYSNGSLQHKMSRAMVVAETACWDLTHRGKIFG
jgi:hypothetical protein